MTPVWDDEAVRWSDPNISWDGYSRWHLVHRLLIDGEPWTCEVTDITVRHGRSEPSGQPGSAILTANLAPGTPAATIGAVQIGKRVSLEVASANPGSGLATLYSRFVGYVTDVSWDQETGAGQIIAADFSSRLTYEYVRNQTWPVENETARVKQIIRAAGAGYNPDLPSVLRIIGTSTAQMLEKSVDHEGAWGLLAELADECAAVAWIDTDGVIVYATGQQRQTEIAPILPVDTCHLLMDVSWEIVSDFANRIIVSNPEEGTATAEDPASISTYGLRESEVSVGISTSSLPSNAASRLTVGAEPRWSLPEVTWLSELAGQTTDPFADPFVEILRLQVGDRVSFAGSVPEAPVPYPESMHVEGWTETHLPGRVEIAWALVDHELYLKPPVPPDNVRTEYVGPGSFRVYFTVWDPADEAAVAWSTNYYPESPIGATHVPAASGVETSYLVTGNDDRYSTGVSVWAHDVELDAYSVRMTATYDAPTAARRGDDDGDQ